MDYKEYNLNPTGKKTGDCVIRAIAKATGQTWLKVYNDLCDTGRDLFKLPNEKKVYSKYLEKLGWEMQKMPRQQNKMGKLTVEDFINKNQKGVFIISVAKHLTIIIDGVLFDTWDCRYKSVGNYWTN